MLIKSYIQDEEVVKQINELKDKWLKIVNNLRTCLYIYYDHAKIVDDELCFYTEDNKLTVSIRLCTIKLFSYTDNSLEVR